MCGKDDATLLLSLSLSVGHCVPSWRITKGFEVLVQGVDKWLSKSSDSLKF